MIRASISKLQSFRFSFSLHLQVHFVRTTGNISHIAISNAITSENPSPTKNLSISSIGTVLLTLLSLV
jgi:hypothetical protein